MAQFSSLAAKKIIQTAKRDHNTVDQRPPTDSPQIGTNESVLGKLIEEGDDNKWSWKQVRRKADGTYVDVTGGVTGTTTERFAFELNDQDGAEADDVYLMRRVMVQQGDGSFKVSFAFSLGGVSTGCMVVITGPASGAGKYLAHLISPPEWEITPTGDATLADFGYVDTSSYVIAVNAADVYWTTLYPGTDIHPVPNGHICPGTIISKQEDGTLIVAINAFGYNLCVNLPGDDE